MYKIRAEHGSQQPAINLIDTLQGARDSKSTD
jgi:hypothetical protein